MRRFSKAMKVLCAVVVCFLLTARAAGSGEAPGYEEAVIVFRSGQQHPRQHMVTLEGEVTPLAGFTIKWGDVMGSFACVPDGRFGLLWTDRSGSKEIMIGETPASEIQGNFREALRQTGAGPDQSLPRMRGLAMDPRGRRLAYITSEGREEALWIAHLDGGPNVRKLLVREKWLAAPSWSPDGQRLAFFHCPSWREVGEPFLYGLFIADLVTGEVKEIAPPSKTWGAYPDGSIAPPAWHPDGKTIFFRSYYEEKLPSVRTFIYKVSADGGPVTRVTEGWGAMVHPDGDRLYYRRNARQGKEGGTVVYDLLAETEVLREGLYLKKISPSGRYLACGYRREKKRYTGTHIAIADKDGRIIKKMDKERSLGGIVGWIRLTPHSTEVTRMGNET